MTSCEALLASLSRGPEATAPRLTHYDGPERIELSGRVLVNWVAKAANLLVEEADAGPDTLVALDLPAGHWRAAYWALAAWATGATVALGPGAVGAGSAAQVVVTDRPDQAGGDPELLVAVTGAALARRHDGPLPPGALDEAAVLATYGDVFEAADSPAPTDAALRDPDGASLSYAELLTPADRPGERVLLVGPSEPALALRTAVATWAAGGSIVVTRSRLEPAEADRLVATERVTRVA